METVKRPPVEEGEEWTLETALEAVNYNADIISQLAIDLAAARAEVDRLKQWQADCQEAMDQAEAREGEAPTEPGALLTRHLEVLQAFRIAHGFYTAEQRRREKLQGDLAAARAESDQLRITIREGSEQNAELCERLETLLHERDTARAETEELRRRASADSLTLQAESLQADKRRRDQSEVYSGLLSEVRRQREEAFRERDAARAEVEALKERLRECRGWIEELDCHLTRCARNQQKPCSCGYDHLLQRIDAALGEG